MGRLDEIKNDLNGLRNSVDSKKTASENFRSAWKWIYKLRSVALAIPVVIIAVYLAVQNMALLPAQVGILMQTNGEFSVSVVKLVAVMGPLAVTAVCLLLMFLSKKVIYPWLISLFSLVLPILLLFINTFPG